MKNLFKHFGCIMVTMIIVLGFAACPQPQVDPPSGESSGAISTLRYETFPYAGTARAVEGENWVLSYSAFDDTSNYYVFYLGHVDKVPVAYRDAVMYNGETPISIGYSKSTLSETVVENSAEKAFEESFTSSSSSTVSASASISAGFGGLFEAEFSAGYETSWGSESATGKSTSNTFTTATTSGFEETDSIEVTIGEHGEKAGKYRYSLFATSDVYYVIITNKTKTSITKQYVSVLARPLSYAWGIDYESDLGGSFDKTAGGNLLEVPNLALSDLGTPSHELDSKNIPAEQIVKTPIASNAGGTYNTALNITLASETYGATIYYTTNGSNPTTSSTRYTTAIQLDLGETSKTTTIKAIAVKEGMVDSAIMSHTYKIEQPAIKTVYEKIFSSPDNGRDKILKQGQRTFDYITADFDVEALLDEDYTVFQIEVWYDMKEIKPGIQELWIESGHSSKQGDGVEWNWARVDGTSTTKWDHWYETTGVGGDPHININNWNNKFSLIWSASGGNAAGDCYLGYTRVKVTALKQ